MYKKFRITFSVITITILLPLFMPDQSEAAMGYWCEYKSSGNYYKTKYDNNPADKVADKPGSYVGICSFTYTDQINDTQGTQLALCHYDSGSGTWFQIYETYTGYYKQFWCEYKNDGSYTSKLEKTYKIQSKIDGSDDPALSSWGLCAGDTDTTVYCRYKDNEFKTKDDTAANVVTELTDFPVSHRGGCTESHEFHMENYQIVPDHNDSLGSAAYSYAGPYDYWGHCTDQDYSRNATTGLPESSWVAPAPTTDSAGEKRLGIGSGNGPTTKKRTYKPRTSGKSR